MAVINHAKREINAKIVYYGPVAAGKGSLVRYIHQRIKPSLCGPLKSMPAGGDNLLFFEYQPFEQAILDGYQVRFHLYTLTGPVSNQGTWKMVLKGVDGVALVAEAGTEQEESTQQVLRALQGVLAGYGRDLRQLPCVLVSNKTDQADQRIDAGWGDAWKSLPVVRSSTRTGEGVVQALGMLAQMVGQQLRATVEDAPPPAATTCLTAVDSSGVAALHKTEAAPLQMSEVSVQLPVVQAGRPSVVQLPVTLQVDGHCRRFTLRVTLDLEEVD